MLSYLQNYITRYIRKDSYLMGLGHLNIMTGHCSVQGFSSKYMTQQNEYLKKNLKHLEDYFSNDPKVYEMINKYWLDLTKVFGILDH